MRRLAASELITFAISTELLQSVLPEKFRGLRNKITYPSRKRNCLCKQSPLLLPKTTRRFHRNNLTAHSQAQRCPREQAPFGSIFYLQTGIHATEFHRFFPEILDAAYKSLTIQPANLCGVGSWWDRSEAPEVAVIVLSVYL